MPIKIKTRVGIYMYRKLCKWEGHLLAWDPPYNGTRCRCGDIDKKEKD